MTRVLVLRSYWSSVPAGYRFPPSPATADSLARDAFEQGSGWSISDYWKQASYGLIDVEVEYKDIYSMSYPLAGTATMPVAVGRATTMADAIANAKRRNINIDGYDSVILWLNPPTDGGALAGTNQAVLDWGGGWGYWGHTFLAHEFGHSIGFQHPVVMRNGALVAYGDPSSLMSAMSCSSVRASGSTGNPGGPPSTNYSPPQIGGLGWWWDNVGPLPTAAELWKYLPGFAASAHVQKISGWAANPQFVHLNSHSFTPSNGAVLLEVATTDGPYLIETRASHGWDRAITEGVYIHRIAATGAEPWVPTPVEVIGVIPFTPGSFRYLPAADLVVTVGASADSNEATELTLSSVALAPKSVSVTIDQATSEQQRAYAGTAVAPQHPCGPRQYAYTVRYLRRMIVASTQTVGLTPPVTNQWTLNGLSVTTSGAYDLPAATTIPSPDGPVTTGDVAKVQVALLPHGAIQIDTNPDDGNYLLTVEAGVNDTSGFASSSSTDVPIDGIRIDWEDAYLADFWDCIRETILRALPPEFTWPRIPGPGPDPASLLEQDPQRSRLVEELSGLIGTLEPRDKEMVVPSVAQFLGVSPKVFWNQ